MIKDMGTTITLSDGHTIPLERLEAHNTAQARARAEAIERAQEQAKTAPSGCCPFSTAINSICREDCALYLDGKCALRADATQTQRKASGKCPFTCSQCRTDCALFCGVCSLTTIFKG